MQANPSTPICGPPSNLPMRIVAAVLAALDHCAVGTEHRLPGRLLELMGPGAARLTTALWVALYLNQAVGAEPVTHLCRFHDFRSGRGLLADGEGNGK